MEDDKKSEEIQVKDVQFETDEVGRPVVKPGSVFFDKLPNGRYEKCVLQLTTPDTPDRHAAARGGTGEFYRELNTRDGSIPKEELVSRIENAAEIIWDVSDGGPGRFVLLEREHDV